MTRFQRLLVLASFLISLFVLLIVARIAGGLGVVELALCVVVAIPLTVLVNRAIARRLGRSGAAG